MSNVLAARFASNTPVLVSAEKADWLAQGLPMISAGIAQLEARSQNEPVEYMAHDDFWPSADSWLSYYRPYNVVKGTLLIPVKGMLLNDFPYQLGSWATGYAYLVKAFERGMADEEVERIAMIIDSPGGEVAGCFDSADRAYAMRGTKPIQSFVNEAAYSAAFAWATVGEKITMTRTAGVGSVGVVTAHMNVSKAMERAGYEITFIHAGKHKVDGNAFEALPAGVKARIQKRIDSMYTIFVSTTARNLGISESVVRDTEALTYGAEEAVEIGFAHEVKAFDEALAAYSGEPDNSEEEEEMPKPNDQEQATFSQADLDNARAAGRAEGHAEGKAEGMKEGATAERTRIQGIMGSEEAKTRPAMASHLALNTQQSVEDAKGILAVSQPEKTEASKPAGADFEAAMGKDNPELGAGADTGTDDDDHKQFLAATGFQAHKGA